MKVCPTCDEVYKDDEINFCLADGSTLLKKRDPKPKKHSRLNEVAAVVLVALAILTFLCLVTYSSSDWSLNTASSQPTRNWIGIVGAVVADLLFQAIGISAYIIPALIAFIAWRVFHAENLRPQTGRVIGFALFVVSVSGLIHLTATSGGLLGAFFFRYSASLLGSVGAAIFLSCLLVVSVILLTNLTFVGFMGHLKLAWSNIRLRLSEWRTKHVSDPEELAAKARERSEKRKEIREGKTGELPPTIVVGETIPIGKITKPDIAAKTIIGESLAEIPKEEEPPPTIAVPETKPVKTEPAENSDGAIPITPIKQTGDLEEEQIEPTDEEPEKIITPVGKPQNYEKYMLPHPSFL